MPSDADHHDNSWRTIAGQTNAEQRGLDYISRTRPLGDLSIEPTTTLLPRLTHTEKALVLTVQSEIMAKYHLLFLCLAALASMCLAAIGDACDSAEGSGTCQSESSCATGELADRKR